MSQQSKEVDPPTLTHAEVKELRCMCACHQTKGMVHRKACCTKVFCGERVQTGTKSFKGKGVFSKRTLHVWNCLSCQSVLDEQHRKEWEKKNGPDRVLTAQEIDEWNEQVRKRREQG